MQCVNPTGQYAFSHEAPVAHVQTRAPPAAGRQQQNATSALGHTTVPGHGLDGWHIRVVGAAKATDTTTVSIPMNATVDVELAFMENLLMSINRDLGVHLASRYHGGGGGKG